MSNTDAEIKSPYSRSDEIRETTTSVNPRGEGGPGEISSSDGSFDQRVSGSGWSWSDSSVTISLLGGILDQLIEDEEHQLVKTEECIKWYEDEKRDRLKKLENLRRLRQLEEEQLKSDTEAETKAE